MSIRPASCIAFSLPGSSGAGALVVVNFSTLSGVLGAVRLQRVLHQLERAGDVDDVDLDRARRLGRGAEPELAEPAPGSRSCLQPAVRASPASSAQAVRQAVCRAV